LALGRKVLWTEVTDLGAEQVVRVLEPVLERERPLVLKVDRGSAFRSQALEEFLDAHEVVILFSPPRRPQYNGSIESQIRWMKPLTRHASERWGSARGEWTREAFEAARTMANELRGKIDGVQSGIPSDGLRAAFGETLREELEHSEREALYEGRVPERVMQTLRRLAIERALVAHGILEVRRRLIPLPKRFLFAA
jgi:transposase InsO family protein